MEDGNFISKYVLITITFILIVLLTSILIYIIYINITPTQTYLQCNPGFCATNIYNGEKRCLENSDGSILYDPVFEVCNGKYTCENDLTPYALQSDGSTDIMGLCENGNICRCLKTYRCPSNIVTMFEENNNILIQKSLSYQGNGGSDFFEFENPNRNFCAIKSYNLNRISPGACIFSNQSSIPIKDLEFCFNNNPCILGLLAFYPTDSDNFVLNSLNTDSIYNVPIACVSSIGPMKNHCQNNSVPVYNKKTGLVECKNTL